MDRRQLAALIAAPLLIITAALALSTTSAAITIPTPAHQHDAARGANTGTPVVVAAPQCVTVTTDVPAVQLDPTLRISAPEVTALQQLVGTTPDSVYGPLTAAALPAQAPAQACPPGYEETHSPLLDAIGALNAQAGDLTTARQAALEAAQRAPAPRVAPAAIPIVSSEPGPCSAPTLPLSWIASCESGCNPTNHNPTSSAAGKYQYLDTTWNGYAGYPTADVAPEGVQDQRAAEDTAGGNYSPWNSSRGCWGGKW